ncbi:hypothetical protein NQ318_015547 [Aromia moschata]|uniref:Transposase n=1 Tax=Aromia moschata TaxID=1265417 RepID=A0AAV8Y8M3_9CUCU|nr:hypothetical protein NQ318_015547 [Aromia moschata]
MVAKQNTKEREFIVDCIHLYRELPALWNVKSKEYHDRDKKNTASTIYIFYYCVWVFIAGYGERKLVHSVTCSPNVPFLIGDHDASKERGKLLGYPDFFYHETNGNEGNGLTDLGRNRIMTSPSPVATAAPNSLSAYAPAPGIGESPTRLKRIKYTPGARVDNSSGANVDTVHTNPRWSKLYLQNRSSFDLMKEKLHLRLRNRIINIDETGIPTVMQHPRVIAPKGKKQIGAVASQERGENVTIGRRVKKSDDSNLDTSMHLESEDEGCCEDDDDEDNFTTIKQITDNEEVAIGSFVLVQFATKKHLNTRFEKSSDPNKTVLRGKYVAVTVVELKNARIFVNHNC